MSVTVGVWEEMLKKGIYFNIKETKINNTKKNINKNHCIYKINK